MPAFFVPLPKVILKTLAFVVEGLLRRNAKDRSPPEGDRTTFHLFRKAYKKRAADRQVRSAAG
jgi:hypothetical protein